MKISLLLIIGMSIFLSGCGYKIMSKEDRTQMILAAMIEGYQMGNIYNTNILAKVKDYHLRDMHD